MPFKLQLFSKSIHAILVFGALTLVCCSKSSTTAPPQSPGSLLVTAHSVNQVIGSDFKNTSLMPQIRFIFNKAVDKTTLTSQVKLQDAANVLVPTTVSWEEGDKVLVLTPQSSLNPLTLFRAILSGSGIKATDGGMLSGETTLTLRTQIDPTDKFPRVSDDELLTKIQRQTFVYFWNAAHPVSGLALERNTSGDIVTSGGSGFGLMSVIVGVHRGFITRQQAIERILLTTGFLKNTAATVKGAYPHWLNGATGAIVPFSVNDNGADLVETSYLAMGLIAVREYFNGENANELQIRTNIQTILDRIEWNWFRKNNENQLYWHYSNDKQWIMNMPIRGWNECLVTYVLAAASTNYSIPIEVYQQGFARNGNMKNGNSYYGHRLPLGEAYGGPLFFAHYSFLGINPMGLKDGYADYWEQQVNHSLINYEYCKANPKSWWTNSATSWGLTASDVPNGYAASSPLNDLGVIAPTGAISSLPYTPTQSMAAIKYFYYTLGDKLFKDQGFVDAYSLDQLWFANSFLAIDQGPQIVMIENYRSSLIWNLCSAAPEVKLALKKLGFTAPYL